MKLVDDAENGKKKLHSERVEKMRNYTQNEWGRWSVVSLTHSSRSLPLTESEAEYTVNVTKHFFNGMVLLEFNVCNTIDGWKNTLETSGKDVKLTLERSVFFPGVSLESVVVRISTLPSVFSEIGSLAIRKLNFGETFPAYVLLKNLGDNGNFTSSLLVSSVVSDLLHSFRVYFKRVCFHIFSTRFECIFRFCKFG
jgi:hypothetical protein